MEQTDPNSPWYPFIWVDAKRMGGEPCFRGTRLPVRILFEYLSGGYTVQEFIDSFDGVPVDKVMAVLEISTREMEARGEGSEGGVKALLDHCVPKQFGFLLIGHYVRTAYFMKWDALENGELLAAAATQFDAFVTMDGGLRFEQHGSDLPIPVLSLVAVSNELDDVAPLAQEVLRLLATKLQRRVYVVGSVKPHSTS